MSSDRIEIQPYEAADRQAWNDLNLRSRNGTFLLDRGFLEYHADRFCDASLILRRGKHVVGLFPANRVDDRVVSHGGLTYGGLITDRRLHALGVIEALRGIGEHYHQKGVRRLTYKPVPAIYHRAPAQEDVYALFRFGAVLVRRDLSATIALEERFALSKGRKWTVSGSRRNGLSLEESQDFPTFMELVSSTLKGKYGVAPVHSADELTLLRDRFPKGIRLFAAVKGGVMMAGALIFETCRVAHAQYIACSEEGRDLNAQDFVLASLLDTVYHQKAYFDFGISTESGGHFLNAGLVAYKESWGARGTPYDFYDWDLSVPPRLIEAQR